MSNHVNVGADTMAAIRDGLLDWFRTASRDLPWRRTKDPYRIWLSEVMLQQTRVDQAAPYYYRFVERYPNVAALAAADLDDVLREWEGLGYYARARNLHRAACMVVRDFNGDIPSTPDTFMQLPGVGRYTAAAVLSIAHNVPLAAVDGNVARSVARLFEIDADSKRAAGARRIQALADRLLSSQDPGMSNEALMELGATICLPREPRCVSCPVQKECGAHTNGTTDRYPVVRSRSKPPLVDVAVALIADDDGRLLIQQRPEDGLLGGLWEFPGGKLEEGEDPQQACLREVREELGAVVQVEDELPVVRHAYSHFKVRIFPFICRIVSGGPATASGRVWVRRDQLDDYALPRANRKILEALAKVSLI